jgi:hypothetical protein
MNARTEPNHEVDEDSDPWTAFRLSNLSLAVIGCQSASDAPTAVSKSNVPTCVGVHDRRSKGQHDISTADAQIWRQTFDALLAEAKSVAEELKAKRKKSTRSASKGVRRSR